MATLKELKRIRDTLKAKDKARKEVNILKKEIKELKKPGTIAFKKLMKKAVITGGKHTLKYLDDLTRPVPVRKTKGKRRRG